MVPLSPTTHPLRSFTNVIAFRFAVEFDGRIVQFFPPELVNRMRPCSPTAQPWELSMKKIFARSSRPPCVNLRHERPPSSVRTTKPSAPAAQPNDSSTKLTVFNRGPVRMFTGSQMFPPSPVVNITPPSPAAQP